MYFYRNILKLSFLITSINTNMCTNKNNNYNYHNTSSNHYNNKLNRNKINTYNKVCAAIYQGTHNKHINMWTYYRQIDKQTDRVKTNKYLTKGNNEPTPNYTLMAIWVGEWCLLKTTEDKHKLYNIHYFNSKPIHLVHFMINKMIRLLEIYLVSVFFLNTDKLDLTQNT